MQASLQGVREEPGAPFQQRLCSLCSCFWPPAFSSVQWACALPSQAATQSLKWNPVCNPRRKVHGHKCTGARLLGSVPGQPSPSSLLVLSWHLFLPGLLPEPQEGGRTGCVLGGVTHSTHSPKDTQCGLGALIHVVSCHLNPLGSRPAKGSSSARSLLG